MAIAADDPWRPLSDVYRQGTPRTGGADRRDGERGLSFADDLKHRIRTRGPLTVEAYMAACNTYYYATRDPLGASGDFTTAPEIHQMFGEMIGACLADCWRRAGEAADAIYAELGPGRGTLAGDALRVIGGGVEPHLVETSPALREIQRARIPAATFHDRIEDLPPRPLLLVANEFLDALPTRQWIGDEQRLVVLDGETLAFSSHGLIVEDSPVRDAAVASIAAHLGRHGGVALLIDYGHSRSAPGDTLQAVRAHRFADPLGNPGDQDLTSHVNFEAAQRAASHVDVRVAGPVPQGEWLHSLGIAQRARILATANPQRAQEVDSALMRLTAPGEMGELFKVMAIHHPDWPAPAGLE